MDSLDPGQKTTNMAGTLEGKFQDIADQIKSAVVDFTTLEVTTLTGNIDHVIKTTGKKTTFDMKNVVSKLSQSGKTEGTVTLIAHTHIDFDHDTVNFIKSDLGKQGKQLFEMHQATVMTAHGARNGFLSFLQEVII